MESEFLSFPYHLVDIPITTDDRGSLAALGETVTAYFAVKQAYCLYAIKHGAHRGLHAHRHLQQLMIPIAGSFKISLQSRSSSDIFLLDNPGKALYIGPMVWRDIFDFSPDAVCLVLASLPYDEADYIRNFDDFRREAGIEE